MKVKEESEKVGLKLNIHKTKIMASGPITSWQIDVETGIFYFLGFQSLWMVTAAMKRRLLLGRKAVTSLDSVLKSMILLTKVCVVKAMVFSSNHVQI